MSFNRSNNKIKSIFQTLAALGIILFFMISCEETSSEFDYEEYPVVEAFLIPGQPVDRVHVFKINDFVDSINSNLGIGGLSICLVVDSIEYILTEKQDSTGYYCYPGDDLE
nr:hypothetical protein [Bacteroidota bacterium]